MHVDMVYVFFKKQDVEHTPLSESCSVENNHNNDHIKNNTNGTGDIHPRQQHHQEQECVPGSSFSNRNSCLDPEVTSPLCHTHTQSHTHTPTHTLTQTMVPQGGYMPPQ